MAKIPFFSLIAPEIRLLLGDGRGVEARRIVIAALRRGDADVEVQAIAAELLDPPKRPRGRRSTAPMKWLAAGKEFTHLRGEGMTYEKAILATAEKINMSPEHTETAVRYYRLNEDPE